MHQKSLSATSNNEPILSRDNDRNVCANERLRVRPIFQIVKNIKKSVCTKTKKHRTN